MKKFLPMVILIVLGEQAKAQNVGIGTTTPVARLHVSDSNVLYSGPEYAPFVTNFAPPVQGRGVRLMWYAQRGAFRAGYDDSTRWNKDSIGRLSVAMGESNVASGFASTALGSFNRATNTSTTTLGEFNQATNYGATTLGADNIASGVISLATGEFTLASGHYSSTFGLFTKAAGNASTALGYRSLASGDSSVAMGTHTTASGNSSTAMGSNTLASGDSSVAMGAYSKASGISSTAMGGNTLASGNWSTSMGYFTKASGDVSTAMGFNTTASGVGSIAAGFNSISNDFYSIAMGEGAKAEARSTVALGYFTTASNTTATALGNQTVASGHTSTAMGYANTASGYISTAMGYRNIAKSDFSLAAGHFNDTTGVNKVFEIGIGLSNSSRKNALTITSTNGGRIGIFKTNPVVPFEIAYSTTGGGYHPSALLGIQHNGTHYINMISNNSGEQGLLFGNLNSGSDGGIIYRALTEPSDPQAIYFRSASWTRFAIYNSGNAWVQGNLSQNSDLNLKKDIVRLEGALSAIEKLNGYTYYWKQEKDATRDQSQQIGLLAQEVEKLYPQLVKTNPEGALSLNYTGLIPVLIEGIKELKKEIEILKNKNHQE